MISSSFSNFTFSSSALLLRNSLQYVKQFQILEEYLELNLFRTNLLESIKDETNTGYHLLDLAELLLLTFYSEYVLVDHLPSHLVSPVHFVLQAMLKSFVQAS